MEAHPEQFRQSNAERFNREQLAAKQVNADQFNTEQVSAEQFDADRVIHAATRRPAQRRQLRNPNPEMRARLLTAAADQIRESGYNNLRIEDIAERAGVSVGTFYLYFEGKQVLFVELVREFSERLRHRLAEADGGHGSIRERMARRLLAYLDFVEDNMPAFLHYRDGGAIDTNVGPLATWATKVHAADLRPLVAEGMAAGEILPSDPELLSQALIGLIQHMAGYWAENPRQYSRVEIERFLLAFISAGIGVDRPAGPGSAME